MRFCRYVRTLCLWFVAVGWSAFGLGCGSSTNVLGLKLNELMAKHSAKGAVDWLEIYNPSEVEVDLTGVQLKDSNATWTFPAGTTIPGKGYLQVICDDTNQGLRTNFKLSGSGETVVLQTSAGQKIDEVTFPKQADDVSWGRERDGAEKWKSFPVPTPGKSNG